MKNFHKNINNTELSMVAFSSLGFACISTGSHALLPLGMALTMTLPFAISGVINKYTLLRNTSYSTFKNGFGYYKHFLTKEMQKHLEAPGSLLEKKYRLIFLSMWCSKYNFSLDFVETPKILNKIEKLSIDISKNNVSQYDLSKVFLPQMYRGYYLNELIEEDINDKERFDIINKVFKSYQSEGFLGQDLISNASSLSSLLTLQNNKLTKADIHLIKENNKMCKNGNYMNFASYNNKDKKNLINTYLHNEEYADILREYIANQKELDAEPLMDKVDLKRKLEKMNVSEKKVVRKNKI